MKNPIQQSHLFLLILVIIILGFRGRHLLASININSGMFSLIRASKIYHLKAAPYDQVFFAEALQAERLFLAALGQHPENERALRGLAISQAFMEKWSDIQLAQHVQDWKDLLGLTGTGWSDILEAALLHRSGEHEQAVQSFIAGLIKGSGHFTQPTYLLYKEIIAAAADPGYDPSTSFELMDRPKYWVGFQDLQEPPYLWRAQPQEIRPGVALAGVSFDESQISLGGLLQMHFYWLTDKDPTGLDENWHRIEPYWVQAEEVINLAINPGFEWGSDQHGLPLGYSDPYNPAERIHVHEKNFRGNQTSTVSIIRNSPRQLYGSLRSTSISVDENALYLLGAWIRHSRRGSLGVIWLRGNKSLGNPYILSGGRSLDWTYVSQVIKPIPGADRAQLWMVNHNTEGEAAFDDLLFVRLPDPGG